MELKRNIAANYISLIYVSLASIVILPFYMRYLGAEAYGLVGFYTLLQTWFILLDVGLTGTMSRETARFQGGAITAEMMRRIFRAMEVLFIAIAVIGTLGLILSAEILATRWLRVQNLEINEVILSIQIMSLIVGMRWFCGLYRGVINGFEKQVWLSSFNAVSTTAKTIMAIPVMLVFGSTPTVFFKFQLLIVLLETFVLVIKTYKLLPKISVPIPLSFDLRPVIPLLKFSFSVSILSIIWIMQTQTDKLILSKVLSLTDYGFFMLAVTLAGGISLLSSPVSTAIVPRLTRLNAESNNLHLVELYRKATQLVCCLVFPAAMLMAIFPSEVLEVWTGDKQLASKTWLVLMLYSIGNALLVASAFPYYMQFAKGNIKMQIYGNIIFLFTMVPAAIWATSEYGMIGAGWTWLVINIIYLLFWTPIVHHRFLPGVHNQWLAHDILLPLLISVSIGQIMKPFMPDTADRIQIALFLSCVGLAMLASTVLSMKAMRSQLYAFLAKSGWLRA